MDSNITEDYLQKQKILEFVSNTPVNQQTQAKIISDELNIDFDIALAHLFDLYNKNLVSGAGKPHTTFHDYAINKTNMFVWAHPNGKLFLKNGGYLKKFQDELLKERKESAEFEKLNEDLRLVKLQLSDYNEVKENARYAILFTKIACLIALVSAGIAVLAWLYPRVAK